MTESSISDDELLAWLDEQLPVERMSEFEQLLRDDESLRRRVAALAQQRGQGAHSVGEIWRRGRLSCPSRGQLGSFLLGALPPHMEAYIEFHLQTVGCRLCSANLDDLNRQAADTPEAGQRRRRIFQSSAGHLRSGLSD